MQVGLNNQTSAKFKSQLQFGLTNHGISAQQKALAVVRKFLWNPLSIASYCKAYIRLQMILRKIKTLIGLTALVVILYIIACGRGPGREACFNYPKQIDSLKVRDLYDTARLYIFTWLCDRKIDNFYRGQLELKYKAFFMRNDSLEIFFTHFLPKDLKDSTTMSDYIHLPSMAFNIKTRQKLWGWDINGFSDRLNPGDVRFESPSSADVLTFIKTHKSILNPCFIALIEKTNLISK